MKGQRRLFGTDGIRGKVDHALRTKEGGLVSTSDIAEMVWANPHLTGAFKMVADEGVVIETKIHKDMSKYYLEKLATPPVQVSFEMRALARVSTWRSRGTTRGAAPRASRRGDSCVERRSRAPLLS